MHVLFFLLQFLSSAPLAFHLAAITSFRWNTTLGEIVGKFRENFVFYPIFSHLFSKWANDSPILRKKMGKYWEKYKIFSRFFSVYRIALGETCSGRLSNVVSCDILRQYLICSQEVRLLKLLYERIFISFGGQILIWMCWNWEGHLPCLGTTNLVQMY